MCNKMYYVLKEMYVREDEKLYAQNGVICTLSPETERHAGFLELKQNE